MSAGPVTLTVQDQLDGVHALLARVNASLEAGASLHNPQRLAQLEQDRGILTAVATTLGWLARDREGCIQMLATRWTFGEK